MPKAELHRHLEGAVRLETVLDEGRRHGLYPQNLTLDELRPRIQTTTQFEDLASLLAMFDNTQAVLKDMAGFHRIAREAVLDAHAEGIRLIELRYAPSFCSMNHGHDFGDVLRAIRAGIDDARSELGGEDEIACGLLCIGVGAMGLEEMRRTAEFALSRTGRDHFCGFDMAGTEDPAQFAAFAPLFRRVKDAGLRITCHASEDRTLGLPENAVVAVRELGADRIGHGIQISRDIAAMDAIRDSGVMLEVSVSSNFLTSAVPTIVEHPVRALFDHGIRVCVNTDDPGIMALTLPEETRLWNEVLGFSVEELRQLNVDALEESFIDEEAKAKVRPHFTI